MSLPRFSSIRIRITRPYVDRLARCAKICYLGSKRDDLGNLSLLANYSTDIDTARYEELYLKRGTALLLGPRYAPLKKRFSSLAKTPSETIDRVLLTTGSTVVLPTNFKLFYGLRVTVFPGSGGRVKT